MTKSTITREQLLEIIETDHVQCGEASYLARMALAAMDSDPVIIVGDDGGDALSYRRLIQSFEPGTKLYRHAQQPVVPNDVLDALQKVARIRLDLNDFDGDRRGIADCLGDAEEALIEVVNRRAAMLAAAPQSPGSEPATVPGKWIPVSERMPESNKFVLLSNGVWVGQGLYDDSDHLESDEHWQDEHREFINVLHHPVTHWMQLPAAPQEVPDGK